MAQYNSVNIKLLDLPRNKLKSPTKTDTEVTQKNHQI